MKVSKTSLSMLYNHPQARGHIYFILESTKSFQDLELCPLRLQLLGACKVKPCDTFLCGFEALSKRVLGCDVTDFTSHVFGENKRFTNAYQHSCSVHCLGMTGTVLSCNSAECLCEQAAAETFYILISLM